MKDHTGTLGGSPAGRCLDKLLCDLARANPQNEKVLGRIYKIICRWQKRVQSVVNGVTDEYLAREILTIFKGQTLEQVDIMMTENLLFVSPSDRQLIDSLTRNVIAFIRSSALRKYRSEA